MAAKHGRTKQKDWDESNNDDTSDDDDDDNSISRSKEISYKRNASKRKRIRSKIVSDDSSDCNVKRKRLGTIKAKSFHQIARNITSNSDDSDSIFSSTIKRKHKVSRFFANHSRSRSQCNKSSSDTDSEHKQSFYNQRRKFALNENKWNFHGKSNKSVIRKIKDSHAYDTSSSKEFQKCKSKKRKKLRSNFSFREPSTDNYTIVDTPSRSDDENIPVEKKHEISLKHYIIEEVDKIQNMTEELKNDLKYHSDYLIDKKVNVVRDSKFIAHKILRVYDSIYKKLKTNRNNFVGIYKTWINSCSNNKLNENKKRAKDTPLSSSKSMDNRDKGDRDSDSSKYTSPSNKSPIKKDKYTKSSDDTEENAQLQDKDCNIDTKNESRTSSNFKSSNEQICKNSDSSVSKVNAVINRNKSDTDSSSSLINIRRYKPKRKICERENSSKQSNENVHTAQLSEYDSDDIFTINRRNVKHDEKENVKTTDSQSSKQLNNLTSSDNEDPFKTSNSSEIVNTSVKSYDSTLKVPHKKDLSLVSREKNISKTSESIKSNSSENERKSMSPKEISIEESERIALNNLLQDDTDSEENTSDVNLQINRSATFTEDGEDDDDDDKPSLQKSNNLLLKNKQLLMQTKKQNSISSDSSSDSAGGHNGHKILRQANGDDLPPRYRRRQAFNVQKNRHYKADKKLRMECRVTLERLSQNVLENNSRALEKSKKYVANKKFHSITNLDGLELKKTKKNSTFDESLSSDSIPINSKAKKKNNSEPNPLLENFDEDDDTDNEKSKMLSNISVEEHVVEDVEIKAKEALLDTCSDSSNEDNTMEVDENEEKLKNVKTKSEKNDDSTIQEESDEIKDKTNKKSDWKDDKILNFQLTDTESDGETLIESEVKDKVKNVKEINDQSIEEGTPNEGTPNEGTPNEGTPAKKKKKQRKIRILDSDSDAKDYSSDEESKNSEIEFEEEKGEEKKKKGPKRDKSSDSDTSSSEKKQKSKRKRIKKVATDSESDDQDSPGKGRKNIRKVLKDKQVADDTKKAAQDEEERLKRIAERQRLFNEMYDARLAGEAKVDKLVLDFDEETKKELVVVDKELVKRLKPHQAKGIKFMWDACFESLKQIEKSEGSGCIIAHCMGLGKTFQVVTLSHTLLSHEETKVRTVMVVCPLSTVLNWVNEFKMWLKHVKNGDDIEIYELTKMKKNIERKYQLESWQKTGGILIIGYEMFRNLTSTGKKMRKAMQESIMRSLVDPGADLVVCDEGHLLKNEDSALSKAMKLVKTLRRVVLTGTPLQNNLKEYHCMVQFVKPNLLGSKKEFLNRFVNPITNGQFDDSTPYDVKLMKKRAHVLHKMLEGSVQRFDYSVLTPFLPPKQEYVIFVRLTEVQIKMYQHYLDNFARRFGQRNGSLFADFQELQRIWTHPYVLRLNAEKVEKANEKKRFEASDSEGSLKDFIDYESESDSSSSSSSISGSNSDIQSIHSDTEKPVKVTRSTRLNIKENPEVVPIQETAEEAAWWSKFVEKEHFEDLRISTKLLLLFGILKESEQIGDKVLVFSQSLYSLTLIEQFLNLIEQETQNGMEVEHLDKHTGSWALGLDYFRLDGSTSAENRSAWCKIFNNPNNTRARLFLISTRAGGLGINLTAANRVIIFDASWNPSHDVQSIFRIYRFGQKKPCYVYRFLAAGTMEEKIYNRQVTKLSLACRVVDEQQIERHYSNNDLAELYQFESYEGKSATLNLPKDRLLAEIFLKYKDAVYNYHEHDSLLENKQEEELDEEERKQAWLEYEEEKQGKRQMINMGNNIGFNQMMMNMNSFPELENIKLLIQKDYPNLPPEHLETVARQAVYDMYRFVDQQAVNQTLNPFGAVQAMQPSTMFGPPAMPQVNQQQPYNPQSQLMNMLSQPQLNYPGVNHMPVYSGRGRPPKHMSMNNPMPNIRPMQAPMHLQQPQMQTMSNSDEVQILTNPQVTPPNIDSVSNTKNIQNE